ncbi:SPOR domain-containing protein [Oxalobacteraceae bacterium OM1]|nr:SPOR domain-containing protein [Oxalobacteraceae bacterium OM1]
MKLKRQQGGTIIGIVIGLVVGLGIALAVAVMITKTPVPFTDKFGKSNAKSEQSGGGMIADPNKPLYGNKTAAKEAAKELKELKDDAGVAPVNTAAAQPEPKAAAKAETKAVVVPAALVEKKTEIKPDATVTTVSDAKPAEAADEKWNYYLQAGAFRDQNDAEGMRGKLALMGVEAKVSERQSENGLLYRVRIGPFNGLDTMNKVRGKLSDNGVDAAVIRMAKQ